MPLEYFWKLFWLQQNILLKHVCSRSSQNSEPWCPRDLWFLAFKLPLIHPTILSVTSLLRDRTLHLFMLIFSPVSGICPGDWITCCYQKKWTITEFSQFLFPRTRKWVSLFNSLFRVVEEGDKDSLRLGFFFGSWLRLVKTL